MTIEGDADVVEEQRHLDNPTGRIYCCISQDKRNRGDTGEIRDRPRGIHVPGGQSVRRPTEFCSRRLFAVWGAV